MKYCALAIITMGWIGYCLAADPTTSPSQPGTSSRRAELAFLADSAVPTLRFTLLGFPAAELRRPPGTEGSPIHVLYPDGRVEVRAITDAGGSAASMPAKVGGQTQPTMAEWDVSIESLLAGTKGPGTYRLYWEFGDARSNELTLLVRAERNWSGEPASQQSTRVYRTSATPKEVVNDFLLALGGVGELRPLLWFPEAERSQTAEEWQNQKLSPAGAFAVRLLKRADAVQKLCHAVEDRWGAVPPAVRKQLESTGMERPRALDQAILTYSGHFMDAYVFADGAPPIHLVRRNGRWHIDVDDLRNDPRLNAAIEATKDIDAVVACIKTRQCQTPDDVLARLSQRQIANTP